MTHSTSGAIRLDDVLRDFGGVRAVDSGSLDVATGEFISLLGPSGSGKMTTLKLIAGFEQPGSGTITLDGRSLDGVPSYRRGFGMVFQNYAPLSPHDSREERRFPAPHVRRSAKGAYRSGGQGARACPSGRIRVPFPPNQLSGGQQQRVALAHALVFNPPVLLMNEPLGALDKKLREEMQFEITRIQRELAITTISVTHDQAETLVSCLIGLP